MNLLLTKKHRIFFAVSAIILAALIFVLVVYFNYYFKKDNLAKYFPYNTVVYANLKISDSLLQNPQLKKVYQYYETELNLQRIDWDLLNKLNSRNLSFGIVPSLDEGVYQFNFVGIADVGSKERLDSFSSYLAEKNWFSYAIANKTLPQNLIAFSNSEKVIKLIADIDYQKTISFSNRVGALMKLNSISDDYDGRLYINFNYFDKNISALPFLQLKMLALNAKAKRINDLCLGIKATDKQIIVETPKNNLVKLEIPDSFGWAVINLFDLASEFNANLPLLAEANPQEYYYLSLKLKDWQGIYKFDINQDILPLLSGQSQIIMADPKTFVLSVTLDPKADPKAVSQKVESIAREYLAVLRAKTISRTLPDHSEVLELVKDNSFSPFLTENTGVNEIKYLKDSQSNFEFAYYLSGNKLFISNSLAKIKENISIDLKGSDALLLDLSQYQPIIEKVYLNTAINKGNTQILAIFE